MGVTSLLSMTVFLQVVADSLPPNSDMNVPLIGKDKKNLILNRY